MSTTVKAGWLKDSQGNKFAPKTMSSQVITNDGVVLEDKINADLETLETSVKEYTDTKVADLVGAAPELLDTFEEVAAAIEANEDIADALQSAIGNKVDKEEGKGLSTNDYTNEDKALVVQIENKVDVIQGAENAGKILSVDEEGNVALNTAPEMMTIAYDEEEQILEFTSKSQLPGNVGVDTSLTTSGDAADAKVVGDRLAELEKMIENGTGSGGSVNIDTTLTVSGSAADAKVVGDRLTVIESTIETEIQNKINVDTTLAVSGSAADSKTVGDKFTELETTIENAMQEHIDIDTTLTVSGAAADAKVVGDKFIEFESTIDEKINAIFTLDGTTLTITTI